jgi:H+/Cl- antiporter ClcA
MPATKGGRPPLGASLLTVLLAFPVGWAVLIGVEAAIGWLWVDEVRPPWFVIALPLAGALGVWAIRRFVGDDGHEPLTGIHVAALVPGQYLNVILAIVATLLGGLALGPEVALVSTGAVIGTVLARLFRTDEVASLAGLGALAAILALFAGPIVSGGLSLPATGDLSLGVSMAVAVPVALLAIASVQVARAGGWLFLRARGTGPRLWALAAAALVLGIGALLVHEVWDAELSYIATSGEGQIRHLATETSVSLVLAVLLVKALVYAASLGSGFRGGPFFPAMFMGGAAGVLVALLVPDLVPLIPAIVSGVVAATIATARMPWLAAVLIGVGAGYALGSWAMVPAAVVAAVVARVVPRFADRLAP